VAQLCVNTLPATKVTLIIGGVKFGRLRVKLESAASTAVRFLNEQPVSVSLIKIKYIIVMEI
jgi:hypothetical protein